MQPELFDSTSKCCFDLFTEMYTGVVRNAFIFKNACDNNIVHYYCLAFYNAYFVGSYFFLYYNYF